MVGISVGSEDLYRVSESGIKNKSGPGNSAENLIKFIKQTRDRLSKTALKDIKVTHVDTWTAWDNDTNKAVIDAIDFVGVNAFPFYESERDNKIENAALLFSSALSKTESRAGNKEVWVSLLSLLTSKSSLLHALTWYFKDHRDWLGIHR